MNPSNRAPLYVLALLTLCACRSDQPEDDLDVADAQIRTVEGARGRPGVSPPSDASLSRAADAQPAAALADAQPPSTAADAGGDAPRDAAATDAYVQPVQPVCTAGETRCLSASVQQTCSAAGLWADDVGCAASCVGSRCGECMPGARECVSGLVPRVCTGDGRWTSEAPCAGRTPLCLGAGECRCRPGESRCDGSQPQVCSTSNQWVDVGPRCAHCVHDGRCSGEECSEARRSDCRMVGCECARNECSGAFCTMYGDGCTETRRAACSAIGCGCVDGACAHGMCAAPGP